MENPASLPAASLDCSGRARTPFSSWDAPGMMFAVKAGLWHF
jgi:hypothetical protein